jgi:hypothetical protein
MFKSFTANYFNLKLKTCVHGMIILFFLAPMPKKNNAYKTMCTQTKHVHHCIS